MSKYTCVYYLTGAGKSPVERFIKSLNPRTRQKYFSVVGMLESFGRHLPEPHAKCAGDDIFELRFRGQEGHIRVLYFFYHQDRIIFTNGFIKKTNKLPRREKQIAQQRRQIYLDKVK